MTVVNKAGYKKEYDFAELSAPEPMQRSLATAFAVQSRNWTSHRTAGNNWYRLLMFTRFLSGLEQTPSDLDELSAAMFKRWRAQHVGSNNGRSTLFTVRALLRCDRRLHSGPAAEELARRIPGPQRSKQSYKETDRERVSLAAQRQFRAAWLRIRENTELLERWQSGAMSEGTVEWRIGQVLDHLALTGDVPRTVLPSSQVVVTNRRLLGGSGPERTWGRLFLSRQELTALAVLLTDRFGWNLSVYDRLPTPTRAPSVGETTALTYQVQIEKRRTGRGRWFSTENITDSGADSPGRLISQALEATAHGRALEARLAPGLGLLMVARAWRRGLVEHRNLDRPQPVDPLVFGVSDDDVKHWAISHQLGGSPFQRTRRTTVTRERRPLQHSRSTHESVYVLPDKHVQQAAQGVIEDGAQEALDQAREAVFSGRLSQTPDPQHQETAVADCEDESTSPWPALAGGCGADYLLCLGCRNAHVHPGHHPKLAHLHQRLQSLRSVLPDSVWDERWRDHLLRLEDLRHEKKIGTAAWRAALDRVTNADRALIGLLLDGSLAP
ncbi:hypothetical protein [Streptomyces altiplanensis]